MLYLLIFSFIIPLTVKAQDRLAILDGQQVFIPKLESREQLTSHPRFKGFISTMFNRPGNFHGPNCYNTALIASGIFGGERERYVSPEEFEAILKNNFEKVLSSKFKDIVVMDAKSSRGHAALYLGDNLIFHKKSYGTQYHYRITDLKDAGVVEENEWTPGPMDDSTAQMSWPELGKLPVEAYRLKSSQLPLLDRKFSQLISKIETSMLIDLKSWAIGRKWGMLGEYLLEDLQVYLRNNQTDKYTLGVANSLKDQVYIFIEEVYFKNNRSSSSILEEICIPEQSDQLFSLIRELGRVIGKNEKQITAALEKLENQDKSRCSLHPLTELLHQN